MKRLIPLLSTTALLLGAGCDDQADPDYKGETLATVRGTVTTNVALDAAPWDATLVWVNSAGSPDTVTGENVSVTGTFPTGFTLDVFAPPPDEALNDYTTLGPNETRIGVAFITALPQGYDLEANDEPDEPFGISEDHLLIYVESDIVTGTHSERLVGGALEAGFHLMDVLDVSVPACAARKDPDDAEPIFDCMVEAAGGLETEVHVEIDDPENLDIPNWT